MLFLDGSGAMTCHAFHPYGSGSVAIRTGLVDILFACAVAVGTFLLVTVSVCAVSFPPGYLTVAVVLHAASVAIGAGFGH